MVRAHSVVTVLALTAVAALSACYPFEPKMYAACEEALKDTLRSPTSYRRISLMSSERPISMDEYLADERSPIVKELLKKSGGNPVRSVAIIEYDASNAFGAMLRGTAECSYDSLNGDISKASAISVKINGKTLTDRMVDSIKRQHDR